MKIVVIALTCTLALTPALAPAQNQEVNVFTFEDASCAAWMRSKSNKALRAQYEFWIRGFVSGHNYADPRLQVAVGNFPGSDALYEYLDRYCSDNPDSSFVGGAIRLVRDLRKPVPAPRSAPRKGNSAGK